MTKLEVKVKINYFHLLPTIENGETILRLETSNYIMEVYMKKRNETERTVCYNLIEKKNESFIHHQLIRSALMDEKMKELNQKPFVHYDYYVLFSQFLTQKSEFAVVNGSGYILTVEKDIYLDYLEKMKNPSDEELKKRKELYQLYHFDEAEFLELELNNQHIPYQKFLSNQF
ncbi:hypothetical protein [Enterococcus sp. ZJ1622]|uniref:hypothetical protein n=1 Tax=Enterococcus sp. ZJ1622 TaxID=2709401 RepID=UPI0013EA2D56|nr:hypothetical protein [Enterococcus sp. ZJ1622]